VSKAVAVAHPNFALSKYWGKRAGSGNFPAVPSLSVTVAGFATRTAVTFDSSLSSDCVILDGLEALGGVRARVVELLDRVRHAANDRRCARVVSANDFPAASGLASSASGFAALAVAAVRAVGLDWDPNRVSDLARRSSASAGRSVFGGFVELGAGASGGTEGDLLAARTIAPAGHLSISVLVGITTEKAKAVGSSEGMRLTMDRSPYARAWLEEAPKLHEQLRAALLAGDFERVGELSEASCLAMHASAIAAGLVYWSGATLEAMNTVRALRDGGLAAYTTIDAGPHVKVLARPEDAERVQAALQVTPGVLRVVRGQVGEGARLVSEEAAA
jgi:diphosphomevalonate decarboxylase